MSPPITPPSIETTEESPQAPEQTTYLPETSGGLTKQPTSSIATPSVPQTKCCVCCNEQYPDDLGCAALDADDVCQMYHYTKLVCVTKQCQLTQHCLIDNLIFGLCFESNFTLPQIESTIAPAPDHPTPPSQPSTTIATATTSCCGCCNEQYPNPNVITCIAPDASGQCQSSTFKNLICVPKECHLNRPCQLIDNVPAFGVCAGAQIGETPTVPSLPETTTSSAVTPFVPTTQCCACCNEQYPNDSTCVALLNALTSESDACQLYQPNTKLVCVAQQCQPTFFCQIQANNVMGFCHETSSPPSLPETTTSSAVTPFVPTTQCCACCNEQYPNDLTCVALLYGLASDACQVYQTNTKFVCVTQQCQATFFCQIQANVMGFCHETPFPPSLPETTTAPQAVSETQAEETPSQSTTSIANATWPTLFPPNICCVPLPHIWGGGLFVDGVMSIEYDNLNCHRQVTLKCFQPNFQDYLYSAIVANSVNLLTVGGITTTEFQGYCDPTNNQQWLMGNPPLVVNKLECLYINSIPNYFNSDHMG